MWTLWQVFAMTVFHNTNDSSCSVSGLCSRQQWTVWVSGHSSLPCYSVTLTLSAHFKKSATCWEHFSTTVGFSFRHCSKAVKGSTHWERIFCMMGCDEVHWATLTFNSWQSWCHVPGLFVTHCPYSSSSLRQYLAVTSNAACMITDTSSPLKLPSLRFTNW